MFASQPSSKTQKGRPVSAKRNMQNVKSSQYESGNPEYAQMEPNGG